MKITIKILFLPLLLASCQSKQAERSASDASQTPIAKSQIANPLPEKFKFSLYVSATGTNTKPPDAWTLDTSGSLNIHTSKRIALGKYQDLNAMATLDPPDLDSLKMFIRIGTLYSIDSSDLNQQCAGDEHYVLKIVPLAATPSLSASFDACAVDYNLLLGTHRGYFRKFINWWERMRIKYRPNQAE
jgi:hypothetical protein